MLIIQFYRFDIREIMVFTLHRYIFRELFKVFFLSSLALTVILCLGSIIGPVQEYGVGPVQVIHLIGYFLPIVLTFVLPIAALFSASLVYGRFASDNELDACRASGISMMSLLQPGITLTLIVAMANLVLSFHVMPAFVQRADRSLKADAKQIIFRNIQRKGFYRSDKGKYLIRADKVDVKNNLLSGVIIAENRDAKTERIIAADTAKIHFTPHRHYNEIQITALNTFQMMGTDQGGFSAQLLTLSKEFGSLTGDDIKFKKAGEIKDIAENPMLFYPVQKIARQAYAQLIVELLAEDINSKTKGSLDNLYSMKCGDKAISFAATKCTPLEDKRVELAGEVIVIDSAREPARVYRCAKALIYIEGDEFAHTLTMEIYNAKWKSPEGVEMLDRRPFVYGLLVPDSIVSKMETVIEKKDFQIERDVMQIIKPASTQKLIGQPKTNLSDLQNNLDLLVEKTIIKIKAETHSRLVFGLGCLPMILIGIGLGIQLKGGHLLSAFGASSIPAALLLVAIMMGKNIAKNPGSSVQSGILMMWAGLAILVVMLLIIYRKLTKN